MTPVITIINSKALARLVQAAMLIEREKEGDLKQAFSLLNAPEFLALIYGITYFTSFQNRQNIARANMLQVANDERIDNPIMVGKVADVFAGVLMRLEKPNRIRGLNDAMEFCQQFFYAETVGVSQKDRGAILGAGGFEDRVCSALLLVLYRFNTGQATYSQAAAYLRTLGLVKQVF